MKTTIFILTALFLLISCNHKSTDSNTNVNSKKIVSDSIIKTKKVEKKQIVTDSLITFSDSLFYKLEPNFTEISKNEFQSYKNKYKPNCVIDSGHFISGSNMYVKQDCKEICDTYLCEKKTNKKLLLPSNYDSGILTMLLSPTCNKMIICSSYDGPDYVDYYENRAEIFVFNIVNGIGVKGIKPAFRYFAKDWSIEDLTWLNDNTIALKIYEGNRNGTEYKYVKTQLHK